MKNFVLLCSFLSLLSCSKSDDNNASTNSDLHPPAWIQGNWAAEGSVLAGTTFNFTSNDICLITLGTIKQCQKDNLILINKSGGTTSVKETMTETTYEAEINLSAGQSVLYSFKKLDDNRIERIAASRAVFKRI